MADLHVTATTFKPSDKSCTGIVSLSGTGPEGVWKWSVEKVIANIDANKNTFYTEVGGQRRKIDVNCGPNQAQFLQTRDSADADPLLTLST